MSSGATKDNLIECNVSIVRRVRHGTRVLLPFRVLIDSTWPTELELAQKGSKVRLSAYVDSHENMPSTA